MNWLILRVFAGLPLHVERTINEGGYAQAYCPRETVKRRHPFDKRMIIEQHKPLLPGYIFASKHFDVQSINSTRVKSRWLQFDGRMAYLTERQMEALREIEKAWRPGLEDFLHALSEISRGIRPKTKYISLSDWREGRAA